MSASQYPLSVSSPCLEPGTSSQITLHPAPRMTRRRAQIQKALQALTLGFAHTTADEQQAQNFLDFKERHQTSSFGSSGRESHADSEATCVEYDAADCQTIKPVDEEVSSGPKQLVLYPSPYVPNMSNSHIVPLHSPSILQLPATQGPQTTASRIFVAPTPVTEQDPVKKQQLINQTWLSRGVDVTKPEWGPAPQVTAEQWEFSVNEFFGDVPSSYYREKRAAEKKERSERKALEKQQRAEQKAAKKAAKNDAEANNKSKAVLARLATSAGWMQ